MTSHASAPLLGRPRRPQNQHHLPPLLVQPTPPSAGRPLLARPVHPALRMTSASASRNCCSVGGAEDRRRDAVSYAVAHKLPKLLNDMFNALLRERPADDVDGWMLRWFEAAATPAARQTGVTSPPDRPTRPNSPHRTGGTAQSMASHAGRHTHPAGEDAPTRGGDIHSKGRSTQVMDSSGGDGCAQAKPV